MVEGIALVAGCSCEGGLGDTVVWECLGDGLRFGVIARDSQNGVLREECLI